MTYQLPAISRLAAPASWRSIDIISDLHLQASEPATFDAWRRYMQSTQADAVFILGDLFEVWIGDDSVKDDRFIFEARCAEVLKESAAKRATFFMHGNRDFLVGDLLMRECGVTLLQDPSVVEFEDDSIVLSHGDEMCLGDVDYLAFRNIVRSNKWQQEFLAKPLSERAAIAGGLRRQSEARKHSNVDYADVDGDAARALLKASQSKTLIHGHTHRPADHALGEGMTRIVLSDWDAGANPPRLEVLRGTFDSRGMASFERIRPASLA